MVSLTVLLTVTPAVQAVEMDRQTLAADRIARQIHASSAAGDQTELTALIDGFRGRPLRTLSGRQLEAAQLGRALANRSATLSPYARGLLLGTTQSALGAPGLGRDGELDPPAPLDGRDIHVNLPSVPPVVTTPGGGGLGEGTVISPTTQTHDDTGTGGTGNGPNGPNGPRPAPQSDTSNGGDDDDDDGGGGNGLLMGLGMVAAAAALMALLANNDDDEDAHQKGVEDALGQGDSWPKSSNPTTTAGNFIPGQANGSRSFAEARQFWAQQEAARRARQQCLNGLIRMLDAMNDAAGAMAAESADTSALVGQSANPDTAATLLTRARAKAACAAAALATRNRYKIPGFDAAVCKQFENTPVRLTLEEIKHLDLDNLPPVWKDYIRSLGPSGDLMKETLRVLKCRANNGDCQLHFQEEWVTTTLRNPGAADIGSVCGGNSQALTASLARRFGLDPGVAWPLENACKSSRYGWRTNPDPGMHHGTDLPAPEGTGFLPIASGRVVSAGPKGGYGNAIVINHDDGSQSLYGHIMNGGINVRPGQYVTTDQVIGLVGSTGHSTGPHVHVELKVPDNRGQLQRVDPEEAMGTLPWCP